jgi:hypothetical protein
MNHILDLKLQQAELVTLFEIMHEGNSILFLGAGASVGEKRYLSKEIIEYYEEYLGKHYSEGNITKFVDILSADPTFDRAHFDNEVEKMLRKYEVTDAHKIVASIPWREILTTNYDLLLERAYDEIKQTSNHVSDIVPIKELREFNYRTSKDEIKYVKLNGCISDKGKYPLAFSSEDFNSLKSFYKNVLNDLKNLSNKISLISTGYSFSDDFGAELLSKFDSYNYRDKKWIYNVDPFPKENALPYYTQQRICIIKCSFEDFFNEYLSWETHKFGSDRKIKKISFTNSRNSQISIPYKLSVKLNGSIKQLNDSVQEKYIKEINYYQGDEPNYNLILRNVDVKRNKILEQVEEEINKSVSANQSTIIPAFFITGEFGIGKSTFTLRLIHELTKNTELDLVAFEIIDFLDLKKENLAELFSYCSAKNIVLYCDEVEVESTFKALIELRRELSIEQFNDFNLFFLVPIRENIYEKYIHKRDITKAYNIHISGKLTDDETRDLVEKLKTVNIINYRDFNEKENIVKLIKSKYKSDSFITLLSLVTHGKHVNDLISAYNQLSTLAQKAFMYTALLHRYQLLMPSSLLKQLLSVDWTEFTNEVIKVEGKGILIQEDIISTGTDPDLYFRTKHPIIADELVKRLINTKDKQYKYYERIVQAISVGNRNSFLLINLLKSFLRTDAYSISKINKLYDIGYSRLSDDPYFILNYSMNLQNRGTESDLKKALELLVYAESLLPYRNHRFIHRRGVLNFELAKLFMSNESQLNFTLTYLSEAEELFITKQLLDPFSVYSYEDYIQMLVWQLKSLELPTEETLQIRIRIEELFELAESAVTEQVTRIYTLKSKFASYLKKKIDNKDFKTYLDELYADINLRPYACILLFYYYQDNEIDPTIKCEDLISEMDEYTDNNEVVKFLFKYYGQNLHIADNRVALFKLARNHPITLESNPLRYHYFHFMAESYDHNFNYGKEELREIKSKYYGLNPEFHYIWLDGNGNEQVFEGKILKKDHEKYKAVKVLSLQQTFRLIKGDYDKIIVGQTVKLKLHFYVYGIMAEILK